MRDGFFEEDVRRGGFFLRGSSVGGASGEAFCFLWFSFFLGNCELLVEWLWEKAVVR